jgi:YD repeat-containing protein
MRPVREEIVGLQPSFYTYDNRGRLSRLVQGSGAQARTNSFAFNTDGYLANVSDQLDRHLTLGYDDAGRVVSQTFPDNQVVGFSYDAAGNPTGLTPPGRPAHTFSFTPVNLSSRYTPPTVIAGTNFTQFTYNLDREMTLVTRPDGQTIQYDYSASGCNCDRLNSLTQPRGTSTYTYDPVTGNLAIISAPDRINLTRAYDGPLLLSETWSGPLAGSVGVAYDNDFRPTSENVNGTNTIAMQYDADGLLTQAGGLTLTNDAQTGLLLGCTLGVVADTWSYDGFAEPITHNAVVNGVAIYNAQYTRDALGRIVGLTEIIGGATTVFTYAYDLAGQLTNVTQNAVVIAAYAYDSNNNRLSVIDSGGTRTHRGPRLLPGRQGRRHDVLGEGVGRKHQGR